MAYKTKELEEQAIEAINKFALCFIEEVVSFLPCDKSTFYNHKLHELDSIKELIEENKVKMKVVLRKQWFKSDNITAQLALYKLVGTSEERKNLSLTHTEHSGEVTLMPFLDLMQKAVDGDGKD